MTKTKAKGEMHGCIVCGKLYQLLVVHDAQGKFVGSKVMSAGGKAVQYDKHPLVACEKHTDNEIERAIKRVFGDHLPELE
jgi:succinate dehydrogenase/fumarate reductase-like Fe-S protein